MALAYPEGECFFTRSALSSSVYNADDPKDFYSQMMVEYVWNREADHGWRNSQGHRHPRSGYQIVKGSNWDTSYGNWTHLPFSYGSHWNKITKRVQHDLCTTGNVFKDREKGGGYKCLAYIRAIYLPVAHAVSEDHPDLCSFVQINFAVNRTVKFWHGESKFSDVKTDAVLGLPVNKQRTLALNPYKLIQLLTLPRQLRKDNCYNLKLLKLQQSISLQPHPRTSKSYSNGPDVAWTTIAKGNFGVDLTWKPPNKSTWEENFIKNVLYIGVGFVPGSGPILQIMFSVGWQLLLQEDAEAAFSALKDAVPGIDLMDKMFTEVHRSAQETREFLPDGWEGLGLQTKTSVAPVQTTPKPIEAMDAMLPMLLQKEVLIATGNDPDKETPKSDEGEGETVVDQAAGDLMDAGETVAGAVESAIPGL
ncbi:MAG: hypothetical protein Q9182_007120 [Xanthomendoza sp. 2 TL-2023]